MLHDARSVVLRGCPLYAAFICAHAMGNKEGHIERMCSGVTMGKTWNEDDDALPLYMYGMDAYSTVGKIYIKKKTGQMENTRTRPW